MNHVKRITSHGSVSIPVAVRRDLEVDHRGRIILQPHLPRCGICGGEGPAVVIDGKRICGACCRKALEMLEGGNG